MRAALRITPSWNSALRTVPLRVQLQHDRLRQPVLALDQAADVAARARAAAWAPRGPGSRPTSRAGRPPGRGAARRARSARRRRCARASSQWPFGSRSRLIASSWSRAVSGSTVTVGQGRKSVRPRGPRRAPPAARAPPPSSTSGGNASGRPYLAITTLRSTPGSSRRPSTSSTRPAGLRVADRRPRDLGAHHLARAAPASLAGRDEQLVQHALVEGHHVAAEAPVLLVAAHDARQRALEHADDAALGPLGGDALDAHHHAVAVQRLLHVDGRDVDVLLPAPRSRAPRSRSRPGCR